MKRILSLLAIVVVLTLGFSSCGKDDSGPGEEDKDIPGEKDKEEDEETPGSGNKTVVYAMGFQVGGVLYKPVYWRNGVVTKLELDPGYDFYSGTLIPQGNVYGKGVVSGGDLYLMGTVYGYDSKVKKHVVKAVYWKNGKQVALEGLLSADVLTSATGIAVNGSDVYVSGFEYSNTGYRAIYWKNGKLIPLWKGIGIAMGIVFNGNDLHIVGLGGQMLDQAMYWKNGEIVDFEDDGLYRSKSSANAIAVSDNDVYIAGFGKNNGRYWKNGKAITLAGEFDPMAIAVSGNNVYVLGFGNTPNTFRIYGLWVNGVLTDLPYSQSSVNSRVSGMAVDGDDVYQVGGYPNTYWKNGEEIKTNNSPQIDFEHIIIAKE